MKLTCFLLFFFSIVWMSCGISQKKNSVHSAYAAYDTDGIKPEEYRQRRSALLAKMSPNSIAVLRSRDNTPRSGDENYRYRQNSDFLYLTGCKESNSTLILIPNGLILNEKNKVYEILFIKPKTKNWTGESLGVEGASEILGFGSDGTQSITLTNNRLKEILEPLLANSNILYYKPSLVRSLIDPVSDINFVSPQESINNLQNKYPNIEIKEINEIIGEMRNVKSSAEIELLQKAVDATVKAHIEAIKSCEPEMFEYQLQAVVEYCFTQTGAEYAGFPSIIGSGPNTQTLHYDANRRKMQSGELVVMDIGAEYHGYSADITRTIPVNGKFTPAQREIYELVLRAQQDAIDSICPGKKMADIENSVMKIISEGLNRLGIVTDSSNIKKYCPHGISHSIGLDVHDKGSLERLVPGMVVTVEPGVYIPEGSECDEKYWNIGIRIEDDIIVTEKGRNVLSASAPKSVNDIEILMKKKGIGNQPVGEE
jgi:Xaa-Pro aminopeptidase